MRRNWVNVAVLGLALAACAPGHDHGETLPHGGEGPLVYFVNLEDGMTVRSPFRVVFGLSGMGVAPAGVDVPGTGHHHLLIDTTVDALEPGYAIPNDARHRHFGKGQTEAVLDLEPGEHTLQLVVGDMNHVPLDPPVTSPVLRVTVVR